jgi:hypothetical protein
VFIGALAHEGDALQAHSESLVVCLDLFVHRAEQSLIPRDTVSRGSAVA